MNFRSLFFLSIVLSICAACEEEGVDPLPETLMAEVTARDINTSTVTLNATKPGKGQAGNWSFVSDNGPTASFSNEQDPTAKFTGDPFETYTLRWTLSIHEDGGDSEKSATVKFRIADSYSVEDLIGAGIPLEKISDSVLVGDIKAAGVTDAQLKAAGVIGETQDSEGNVYPWVKIKKNKWMTKNLRATKYSDGTPIPNVTDYKNDPTHTETYGPLYNWYNARRNAPEKQTDGVQGVCPTGWHIPTYLEYSDLPVKAELLKTPGELQKGTGLWYDAGVQPPEGNNKSGFSALPVGYGKYESDPDHPQHGLMYLGFTTATGFVVSSYSSSSLTNHCGTFYISYNWPTSTFVYSSGGSELSVRCVMD